MIRSLALAALTAVVFASSTASAGAQTLERMAGQMIVVGFGGDDVDDKSVVALRKQIAEGTLGGVMYLKPNVQSLERVKAMNEAFLAASPDLPPFLTLDQEGGAVERLTEAVGFREEPNAETVAKTNTPDEARALYQRMATSVAAVGFTVNFGPVVDLNVNTKNQVIAKYGRAFSSDPGKVTAYAEAFVRAHRSAGLLTALKHYPGHGSSTADSHGGFVDITRTWTETELEPYRTLISAGLADMVMVGHLFNAKFAEGEGQLPSSLSRHWIDTKLRGELGFDGVVITDDLEMGAIRDHYGLKETVLTAVRAGVDVLLFSNTAKYDPALAANVRAILVAEAENDLEFRARVEESFKRITALKGRIAG